jgi:peptide-methionine (S)-S-oxide reductase
VGRSTVTLENRAADDLLAGDALRCDQVGQGGLELGVDTQCHCHGNNGTRLVSVEDARDPDRDPAHRITRRGGASDRDGTPRLRAALQQVSRPTTEEEPTVLFSRHKTMLPAPEEALSGASERWFPLAERHLVLDAPLVTDEVPDGLEVALFGLGCFWGAEEIYWQVPGVWSTSVGYAGGHTPNPSYEQVCTGRTGHTEAVRVVFDPAEVAYADLVRRFFEIHDPTQGMRQGNDVGTQYRSAIYTTTPEQAEVAERLRAAYQDVLTEHGLGPITTEVRPAPRYYYAEDHHQQYLAKNPHGYRCHAKTGVPFPAEA